MIIMLFWYSLINLSLNSNIESFGGHKNRKWLPSLKSKFYKDYQSILYTFYLIKLFHSHTIHDYRS